MKLGKKIENIIIVIDNDNVDWLEMWKSQRCLNSHTDYGSNTCTTKNGVVFQYCRGCPYD